MKLKHPMEYYSTDQGIKMGDPVVVWGQTFDETSLIVKEYQNFNKGHFAGGMVWRNACPIAEPHEINVGEVAPAPVEADSLAYRDVWVKAYATAGDAVRADSALAEFKVREASGDFKK